MISNKSEVTLYFSLELEDGSLVDSNFGHKPATLKMGDGSLLPGFEKQLIGLNIGDKENEPG